MSIARESLSPAPELAPDSGPPVPSSQVVRPKILAKSEGGEGQISARPPELLNEIGLRSYVSGLARSGQPVRATLLIAPTASPEISTSLPELFWKLVERRIHAATFAYMSDGRLREETIRVTPNGYLLQRS